MGGGPQQTTQTEGSTSSAPWAPAIPALKQSLALGKNYQRRLSRVTPAEREAFQGIRGNARFAEGYMPAQQDLVSQLYAGGGMGERNQDIRDAMDANRQMLSPYMQQGYLDPMTNPYLQPAIEQARQQQYSGIADKFQSAGRGFSGAMGDAMARGMTSAALPMLLGQYNANVQAQQNAGQAAMQGATQGALALDQSQQARLQAQMAAPQQIQNLNVPQNMMLEAEARRRNIPLDVLARTTAMFSGMGAMGGTGTSMGTGMQQQYSNPWMTGIGAGVGLLGLGASF
jgi:hypothetical protein